MRNSTIVSELIESVDNYFEQSPHPCVINKYMMISKLARTMTQESLQSGEGRHMLYQNILTWN